MKIQEIESRSGLERATIRYYEREGLLQPARTENGYRDYSEADLEELKKIKLLRQLGMTLDKIRELQQGRVDFSAAMDKQIAALEQHIADRKWAREVCQEIRASNANYGSLQPDYYLELLRRPQYEPAPNKPQPVPVTPKAPEQFQEKIRREIHPWRRFLARMTDHFLFLSILNYVLFVVLRVRMVPDQFGVILGFAAYWIVIPVEAFLLHFIGTTPGKWIFGVKLEYFEGGKLPYMVAFGRGFEVLRYGQGFGIPIWRLFRYYKSHTDLTERYETVWDKETEVTYTKFNWKGKTLFVAAVCLILAMDVVSAADLILPQYRGDLTIQEFSENYRFYHEKMMDCENNTLNVDGTWHDAPASHDGAVIDLDGTLNHETANFMYELEDESITAIRYEDEWVGFRTVSILPDYLVHAAVAYVTAQPGMTADKLVQWGGYMAASSGKRH